MSDDRNQHVAFWRKLFGFIIGSAILLSTGILPAAQSPENERSLGSNAFLVSGTVALALEGKDGVSNHSPVRFAGKGAKPPSDPAIQGGEFRLVSSALIPYEQPPGETEQHVVAGVHLHRDSLGRTISTGFKAGYRLLRTGSIVIDTVEIIPVKVPDPPVYIGFVPTRKVTKTVLQSHDFLKLFKFVESNAMPRFQCRESRGMIKPYYVFAFFMERLHQDAKVNLLISTRLEGFSGDATGTKTFQDHGWYVAYAPSNLALDGDPEVFIKALYTPGGNVSSGGGRQIIAGVSTTNSVVRQVQKLLSGRGYDPGPADGLIGRRTRSAIKEYQRSERMKEDGKVSSALLVSLLNRLQAKPSDRGNVKTPPMGMPAGFKSKVWPNGIESSK